MNDYNKQALDFLSRNGLKLRITLSNSKVAPWDDGKDRAHYRVTLSKRAHRRSYDNQAKRLAFDFWTGTAQTKDGEHPSEYDVLACLSSDLHCDDTLADFCANAGYSVDSISAKQTWTRCKRFSERLQGFFTQSEQEQLSQIQ